MAATTTVNSPDLKRKAEAQQGPQPKRMSPLPVEEFDLYPLFFTVLSSMPEQEGAWIDVPKTVALLSQNPDVLFPLHQVPINKINEQFKNFLVYTETTNTNKKMIFPVLSGLYQISLRNSSTPDTLAQTAKDLPSIAQKLQGNVRNKIGKLLEEAKKILSEKPNPQSLKRINSLLPELNEFRNLKQYADVNENHRMRHLADTFKQQNLPIQYPQFLSDYPHLVAQISSLSRELDNVSQAIADLNNLKEQLIKSKTRIPVVLHPLETRFIQAYGGTFYETFAEHFWTLLWKSKEDPEVKQHLAKIPAWKTLKPDLIDYAFINEFWRLYLPDHEFSEWILARLKTVPPESLDALELKLQEFSKQANLNKIDKTLTEVIKLTLMKDIDQQMRDLCRKATIPEFVDLKGLKLFLSKSISNS